MSFRGAKLECSVLTFHVAKFAQSFAKFCLEKVRVCGRNVEHAYSSQLGLLRSSGKRPRGCRATENTEKFAPPHVRS